MTGGVQPRVWELANGRQRLSTFVTNGVTFAAPPGELRVSARVEDGGLPSRQVKVRIEALLLPRSFECVFVDGRVVLFAVNDVRRETVSAGTVGA